MSRWFMLTVASLPLLWSSMKPADPSLMWWTTHALEKVRPYDSVPAEPRKTVHLTAARNEFEPFQIVVRAEGRGIQDVDLQPTDLSGPAGARISGENVRLYLQRFLNLKQPSSVEGHTGEWPDPLIPRVDAYFGETRNAFPFSLRDGRNQPIWVEVYVPLNSPPGEYRGEIAVSVGKSVSVTVPLQVTVWNFSLPSTSSFTNTFGLNGMTALRQHKGRYTSDRDVYDLTHTYRKSALLHRVSTHGGSMTPPALKKHAGKIDIDWTLYDEEVGPFLDGTVLGPSDPLPGAKATSEKLSESSAIKTDSEFVEYYREFANHFREKGWFDRLFLYVWDEPKPEHDREVARRARLARTADPEIRNLVTTSLRQDWTSIIDVWVPLINCLQSRTGFEDFCNPMVDRSAYAAQESSGNTVWWYQSCASHGCFTVGSQYFRGWPSYMIDHSSVANRIMPWMAWKYGINGELYFNMTEAYSSKRDPWTDVYLFGGNGDGTLFYPGRPDRIGGTTHIPIESIRLKLIREGLEDYEFLKLIEAKHGWSKASEFVNGLVSSVYDYERDPGKMYEIRNRIGEELSE